MSELRALDLAGATGTARTEWLGDREYLVVPTIALIGDNVIHAVNAPEAEFVPARILSADGWDRKPLMLGHPVRDGQQISANDPKVLAASCFGFTANPKLVGKRLGMESWCDVKKLEALGQQAMLADLREGRGVEVSTGSFVNAKNAPGIHQGKRYGAEWISLDGDHLAFLPGGIGACSREMGCGTHRAAMRVLEGSDVLKDLASDLVLCKECDGKGCKWCNDTGYWNAKEDAPATRAEMKVAGLKTLGGPGSGNFGHGPNGEPAGGKSSQHEAAASAHEAAASAHENAAAILSRQNDAEHGATNRDINWRSRPQPEAETRASVQSTKDTGAKPFGSSAAATYSKMAKDAEKAGSRSQAVTYHQMAASYHRSAANQHRMEATRSPRNAQEGREMKKSLSGLLRELAQKLRGAEDTSIGDSESDPGDPASLIVYEALTTLMENASSAMSKSDELIADLMASAESYDEDDEDACELACARLNALEAMCMGVYSSMNGVMDAVRQQRSDWYKEQVGALAPISVYRGAKGAEFSAKNKNIIQTVHDHSVSIGASCDPEMRANAAKMEDCPTCNGTGQVKDTASGKQQDCPTCGGEGQVRAAETMRAACSCEEAGVEKKARIAALIANEHNPMKDLTEKTSDEVLAVLEASAETNKKNAEALRAAQQKQTETEAQLKAAQAAQLPEAELASLRSLAAERTAREAAEKVELVTKLEALKTLSKEELEKRPIEDLRTMAKFAKIETPAVDFSVRGVPVQRSAEENSYAPPDSYGLKALQEQTKAAATAAK